MSVRKLEFTLSANGILPQTVQSGGVQFEHNATAAVFIIPSELYSLIQGVGANKTILYRVDVVDGDGGYHPSETIEPELLSDEDKDFRLVYPIPYDISSIGGMCQLTVVATRIGDDNAEEMIYCAETAFIEFSHIERSDAQHDKFKTELGGILNEAKGYMIEAAEVDDDGKLYVKYVNGKTVYVGVSNLLSAETITAAVNATNSANKAALDASNAANEANSAANDARQVRQGVEEGGFIESLKEMNSGGKLTFWVGTQAEYEAITHKQVNCFYLIVDDTTTEDIKTTLEELKTADEEIKEIINGIGDYIVEQGEVFGPDWTHWKYKKFASGEVELWTSLTLRCATTQICEQTASYPFNITAQYLFVSSNYPENTKVERFSDVYKLRDNGNGCLVYAYSKEGTFTETNTAGNVSVYIKGTWK